jgi:hypothetical protein
MARLCPARERVARLQKNRAALDPSPPSRYLFTASMSDLRRCATTGSGPDTAITITTPARHRSEAYDNALTEFVIGLLRTSHSPVSCAHGVAAFLGAALLSATLRDASDSAGSFVR